MTQIKALAHRGYPTKYPENTLISYRAAYDLGFTHLELDTQLSKDGEVVLMHDATIDRTTNGKGFIGGYTLGELKNFRVGEFGKIPTLGEALDFARDKVIVSIELKQKGDLYPELEERVLDVIENHGMMDQVYVNSFDHYAVQRMRTLSKDIELGIIQHGASPAIFSFMKDIKAKYISLRVEYLTDKYVKRCEQEGISIVVWPVDTESQFNKVANYPSVLSTTNNLELFKQLYEQRIQES